MSGVHCEPKILGNMIKAFQTLAANGSHFVRLICTCVIAMTAGTIVLGSAGAQNSDFDLMLGRFRVFYNAGNYASALTEGEKLEAFVKTRFGSDHPNYALALNDLALVYLSQGRYAQAEQLLHSALAIRAKAPGFDRRKVAETLHDLAKVYQVQGKVTLSEEFDQRALTIYETMVGTDQPEIIEILNDLAIVCATNGEYEQAEGFLQRALAIGQKVSGNDGPNVEQTLGNLAHIRLRQGNYVLAQALYERALAIQEKVFGADHPDVANTLDQLALVYQLEGRYDQVEAPLKRALAIQRKTLGDDHPDVARTIIYLALMDLRQSKYPQAKQLFQQALIIEENTLGVDHPHVAATLDTLAVLCAASGDGAQALAFSRKASAVVLAHTSTAALSADDTSVGTLIEQDANYFREHVANLAMVARGGGESTSTFGGEAFEIAQRALQSSVGAALQQMASRFASGGGAVATLIRGQQDLAAFWRERNKALIGALSKPDNQQNRALIENIRTQMADAEARLTAVSGRLVKEFPEYAAMDSPQPLKSDEVQKLLGSEEALVFFLTSDKESYVFAITQDDFDWKVIPLGGDALAQKVATYRRGLDIDKINKAIKESKTPDLFDLGLANELYTTLFGQIEPLIRDKKQLLIVPAGAFTALPFDLLVTDKPTTPRPDKMSGYRDAAWLIKRQAVTVLPLVTSLKALRVFARKTDAKKALVGFGDPLFNPNAASAGDQRMIGHHAVRSLTTRSYTEFWLGAEIDRSRLAEALPPLPDTAVELEAVAKDLGAPSSDLHLGKDATVTTLKQLPMADYRVVYFATHALVAGDVKGLGEPALALSIPAHPTDVDDGLLTASEIAQLKLNADWVVLSACNTVAGDKPGAEALSGLARAFFYAGARALLVSQWAVATDAAARLTTSTFDILKANPTIGRAEALRRAELAYLNDISDPRNAYPAFWGPFEIVGDGAK